MRYNTAAAFAALALALGGIIASAQLPDAPRAQIAPVDRILIAGVFAVRMEDAASTTWAVANGAHEDELPGFIAYHPAVMVAYGAGVTYLQYRVSHALIAHGHPRLARVSEIAHIAATGYAASRNWTLPVSGSARSQNHSLRAFIAP